MIKNIIYDIIICSIFNNCLINLKGENVSKRLDNIIKIRPFIKWAGGKGGLLEEIKKVYPKHLGREVNKYCEPFIGGGAVLFDILSNYKLDEIYISDANEQLINVYKTIRDNVEELIEILNRLESEYIPLDDEKRKEYYYAKRDEYNKYIINEIKDITLGSALFIFLNRTCFNGLYRVNQKGQYNVPMGAYKNPKICDKENLRNISENLQHIIIKCGSYEESLEFVDENTFVYFDPPYRPLTKTASFTSYDKADFTDKDQIYLAAYFRILNLKGAKLVLSNSDPKNTDKNDNFFDELYCGFNIQRIEAKRRINSNSAKRGNVFELLITNY